MTGKPDPAQYESWYHTPRGRWIGDSEFRLMMSQLDPAPGSTLLDVGCGTGYFTRRFVAAGLDVTGLDPDRDAIAFARSQGNSIEYLEGDAARLPFGDKSFDVSVAITSLCLVANPEMAIAEMWRVSRRAIVLGLLNRRSLLYLRKRERGAYKGARWDKAEEIVEMVSRLQPPPGGLAVHTAIVVPSGDVFARVAEAILSARTRVGGFLSVCAYKP